MLISSDFSVSSQNTPLLYLWSLPDLRKSAFLTTNYKDILVIIVCTPPTKAFHLQIISEDTLIMGILLFQLIKDSISRNEVSTHPPKRFFNREPQGHLYSSVSHPSFKFPSTEHSCIPLVYSGLD